MGQQLIALPAVLTAQTAVAVHADLQRRMQALPAGTALALDATGVQSFDSAGLALLLACRRTAQERQQTLQVQGWPHSLQALAQVYGVLPLLDAAAPAVTV